VAGDPPGGVGKFCGSAQMVNDQMAVAFGKELDNLGDPACKSAALLNMSWAVRLAAAPGGAAERQPGAGTQKRRAGEHGRCRGGRQDFGP